MAYPKGKPLPEGSGRKKGVPNKVTTEVREAFRNLLEMNTHNFMDWLSQVASQDPAKALSLSADLAEFVVPKLARTEVQNLDRDGNKADPAPVRVEFVTVSKQ